MSLLTIADSFYIGVLDLTATTSWYIEKLGLQKSRSRWMTRRDVWRWDFRKRIRQTAICLGPRGKPTDGTTPMLYASNVNKAREVLSSVGVNVGDIQQDRQGTHYFEMRDWEGNLIEESEEPQTALHGSCNAQCHEIDRSELLLKQLNSIVLH